MANGDADDYVLLHRIRPGLKREFTFAIKSRVEYSGTIGRTRARKTQNASLGNGVSNNSSDKRLQSSGSKRRKNVVGKPSVEDESMTDKEILVEDESVKSDKVGDVTGNNSEKVISVSEEEEPQSDVVDLMSDDDRKSNLVESGIREEEQKEDVEKPISEEDEVKRDAVETMNVDNQPVNIGESVCEEKEPKEDVVVPMCEELPKVQNEARTSGKDQFPNNENLKDVNVGCPCKGENTGEVPSLAGEESGENASSAQPTRRITRSALKTKAEPLEISVLGDEKTEEVAESDPVSSLVTPNNKLEMKMSKKIVLNRFPAKLKELLETGLLEGLPVRYLRGSKVRGRLETGLKGTIKGYGILCYCDMCNGTAVLTPNKFELHAGSANKRPPEYIHLENGNTLRDVLNACKDAPLDMLEDTIQRAIGCSTESRPTFCLSCKGSIPDAGNGKAMLLCNSCMVLKESQPSPPQMNDHSDRLPSSVPIQKSPDQVAFCSSSRSKGQGRLTRKDLRMHKLVFEEDVLADGTALAYYARGQKLLEGYKKGLGIFCLCCNSEVSPSQFEAHAGWASRRKPYLHIYTSNGVSLHELSIRLSKQRKCSTEKTDDLCSICADGGDLLLCDSCPRAFHPDCVSLPCVPQGTWYCKYCKNTFQKERFVERNANAVAAGRVAGIDAIEQITKRCIRIVETLETEVSACVLCRSHDFSNSGFGPRTVILCDQCEKEYHVGCLREHKMDDLEELPEGKWFCCADCNRIHSALQKLVADGEEKLPDTLLNMIKNKYEEKGSEGNIDLDISWRLLSGHVAPDETRSVLSRAVAIFHDRFDPIADSSTSRVDLIPNIVYGRNVRDQDFGGMYCAILTVNSLVVCAGIIRIFGQEVAELPLVATSIDCQGQGYFKALFSCIENLLGLLGVRNLVLPAADEAESIWINKFGFKKITEEQLKQYRKDYQMMIFQGTSMLHKAVSKS